MQSGAAVGVIFDHIDKVAAINMVNNNGEIMENILKKR